MAIVSHSEVETYLLCTRRHMYAFGDKIQKKVLSESLRRGIDGHYLMELFFKAFKQSGSWDKALAMLDAELTVTLAKVGSDSIGDVVKLHALVRGFLDFYKKEIQRWEIVHVEHEFQVEAEPGVKFGFRPDLIIKMSGYYQPI